eukprot:GFUD01000787.1.p1 GENE.GFUD01000787.1~~GFUD01000787.1.p1  ORF type:complete len:517 (+),score=146.06 GFUD01000787.1:114-1553(+)
MVVELGDCNIKLCHSRGCPDDCPHWRRVPGFPVFGVGQPSEAGFAKIGEKVPKEKTIWFNMRQEPVAYVGGQPVTPRKTLNPHDNIEIPGKVPDMDALEDKLVDQLEGRKCGAGNIDIFRDKEDAENPMDREEVKEPVKLENLKSFTKLLGELAAGPIEGLAIVRVPVMEEKALPEECFDIIVKALAEENPAKTQCIFSSQLGKGRTTFGMTIACIVKAIQMSSKLNKMVDTGIGSRDWADGIIHKTFEELAPSEDLKDAYLMGEFEVIKELLEKVPATKDGKVLADKMIDICGVPPEGTGIQNLRKCIITTKYKYDAATEDRQTVWKKMIINFIERYFYLICFATYAKQYGPDGFKKTFMDWINENAGIREMIANGKDKLEWSRKVDQSAVNDIQSLISGADIKEKLGEVVTKLYKVSHQTYGDMPRGTIKDTLMRKLTCKTLMEILPSDILAKVKKELEEKKLSSDFETVVGLVIAV